MKLRTVDEGFNEFVKDISPAYNEPEAAAINLCLIESTLKSKFSIAYLASFGATGHGTDIPGYSARDCFAVIKKSELFENSGESLEKVANGLLENFPNASVTGGRPVVSIAYGKGPAERHHIVPAFLKGKDGLFDVYGIPAPRNRWIDACPGAHSAWLNQMNEELGRKLKPLIRIVKAWNYYNGEPLWSFYIELCVTEFLKRDSSIIYSFDLKNFFDYMVSKNLAPFEGSAGCRELVFGTSVEGKNTGLAKLKEAAQLADQARKCETSNDTAGAYFCWRKLFNYKFPAY